VLQPILFSDIDGPQSWSWAGSALCSASLRGVSGRIVNIPAAVATLASTSAGGHCECTRRRTAPDGVPCATWDATIVIVMAVG
jgi:hypothetical protein